MNQDRFHGLLEFWNFCFGAGCMCQDVGVARGLDKGGCDGWNQNWYTVGWAK